MARNTNTNLAPGGGGGAGGGGRGADRGGPKIKVSSNVSVKPKGKMTAKEVERLKSINAPKTDPNKGRAKSATKAANKDVAKKPLPKLSAFMGRTVTGAPKQVSPAKSAKYKATNAKTAAKKDAKKTKEMDEYDKFVVDMKKYQGR
jgi:hypothetical protein